MSIRVLPQVLTVGDTTFGTSSNPLLVELSNGWRLRMPQSVQTTPDGFVVEGHGCPPTECGVRQSRHRTMPRHTLV